MADAASRNRRRWAFSSFGILLVPCAMYIAVVGLLSSAFGGPGAVATRLPVAFVALETTGTALAVRAATRRVGTWANR